MGLNYFVKNVKLYDDKIVKVIVKDTNSFNSNYKWKHEGFAYNKEEIDYLLKIHLNIAGFVVNIHDKQIKADTSQTLQPWHVGKWYIPKLTFLNNATIYTNTDASTALPKDKQYMLSNFFNYAIKIGVEKPTIRRYDVNIKNKNCKHCEALCVNQAWIPRARFRPGDYVSEPWDRKHVFCTNCREHMDEPGLAVLSIID